ncbi:MAG: hypothetical protein E7253_01565 [Lachnospiraceae bacterium]|nr:hypothetical protein [Lachnospiraceae bacterium]
MFFDDIKLGMSIELESVMITKEQILSFGTQYDPLLLHTDEEYAKTTRFGDLIAPGVMSFMLVWSKYLKVCPFVGNFLAGKSTSMEWHKPVYAGDVLTGTCEVTKLTKRGRKNGIVEVTVSVHNQDGVLVLTDVTEVIVHCNPEGYADR